METTNQRKLLHLKIKHLEDQKHELQSVIDNIQRVLQLGQAWMEGKKEDDSGKTLSFRDISHLLEDTAVMMDEKYQDFRGDDGQASCVSSPVSPPVTSPMIVTSTQASDVSKSALSRIQVLEEAVSSLSITVSKHSENLSETNTGLENLTDKQCQMSEDQIKVSTETEESLKQLTYKHTKTEMEQNKKFEDLEHKLEALEKAQSEVDEKTAKINEKPDLEARLKSLKKDVKKQNTDLSSLKGHIEETLAKKVEDVAQKVTKQEKSVKKINKLEQRLDALEEREAENIEKVETVEKKLAREKIKLENFEAVEKQREEKLEFVEGKLDQLSSKVDDQKSSIQELTIAIEKNKTTIELAEKVETLSNTVENQKSSIQELTSTVSTHSTNIDNITSNRQTVAAQLTRLQNKVRLIKRERNQAIKKVGEQFDDVGQKYQMVCKIVADRLVPLERLREILNEKATHSEENVDKLYKVVKDVADLVPRVSQIESQLTKPSTGVTAQLQDVKKDLTALKPRVSGVESQLTKPFVGFAAELTNIKPVQGNILDKWNCYAGNTGGHFDTTTGMFTVPQDGLYAVSCRSWQSMEGTIRLCIKNMLSGNSPNADNDYHVIDGLTNKASSGDCDFTLKELKSGDKLYVYVFNVQENPTLPILRFSVFLTK